VVDGLAAAKGGRGFVAMSDETRAALQQGQRLPDFPDKSADDLTEADLKASAYYFVRKEGSFELTTKPDRVDPTAIKMAASVKERAAKEGRGTFEVTYSREDVARIVREGRKWGLSEKEIEDMIFVGSRKDKALTADALIDQVRDGPSSRGADFPTVSNRRRSSRNSKQRSRQSSGNFSATICPTSASRVRLSEARARRILISPSSSITKHSRLP